MAFGIVIAAIYGFTTHDIIGMIFLGAMALALVIVAIFIVVAEREANLAGDEENMPPRTWPAKSRARLRSRGIGPFLRPPAPRCFCSVSCFCRGSRSHLCSRALR